MKTQFDKFRRFTVRVKQGGLDPHLWAEEVCIPIIASSPAEAVNAVKAELLPQLERPTEFTCAGRRGGIVSRWAGWETVIGAAMWAERAKAQQLSFAL